MKNGKNTGGVNSKDTTHENQLDEKQGVENSRRRAVRNLLAGTGVVATGAQLAPTSWLRPVVNTVVLPAHAQTSMVTTNDSISGTVGTPIVLNLLDYFISPSYAELENDLVGGCVSFDITDNVVDCALSLVGGQVLVGQIDFDTSELCIPVDGGDVSATVFVTFEDAMPPTGGVGTVDLGDVTESFTAEKGAACTPTTTTTTTTIAPETSGGPT